MSLNSNSSEAAQKTDLAPGIAARLREDILNGTYPPGARLPAETALAESFGVSRPTLREALHRLAAQGFIETRRGARGGAFVTEGSAALLAGPMSGLLELAAIRDGLGHGAMLQAYAAALDAALGESLRDPARRAALDPALRDLLTATPATLAETHLAFHRVLCDTAPNPLSGLVARALAEAPGTPLTPAEPTPTDCSRIVALCTRLAEALGAGDGAQLRRNLSDWISFVTPRVAEVA